MIRTLTALSALALMSGSAIAEDTASLIVTIDSIKHEKGVINLGLFDEAGYQGQSDAVDGSFIKVDASSVTVTFEGLKPGQYGVKIFHDVNENGKMDTNPFGLPTEPYAFSNNAKGRFGPAKWEQASFDVAPGETVQTISMN